MALTCVQLVSLALMGVGCLVLMAGVASPVWERYTYATSSAGKIGENDYIHVGLFYSCKRLHGYSIFDNCKPFDWDLGSDVFKGDDLFFKVVRVLMCQSVFFMLVGSIAGIVFACQREDRECIAVPGLLNMLGAMGGVAGVVTYAMWGYEDLNPFSDAESLSLVRGWSFYMSAAASGFVLLWSLVGLCSTGYKGSYVLGAGCGEGIYTGTDFPIYTTFDKNAKYNR